MSAPRVFEADGYRFEKTADTVSIFGPSRMSDGEEWYERITIPRTVFAQAIVGLAEAVGVVTVGADGKHQVRDIK